MIVGIDAGGNKTAICGALGVKTFLSDLGPYRERNLTNELQSGEFVYQYQGRKGFAGKLARREAFGAVSRKGITKAHEDAKIRVLIALHQYSNQPLYEIVVGQPIISHTKEEKQRIKDMLEGTHEITVNDVTRKFVIKRCEVAAEGVVSGLLVPFEGKIRIMDIGSGTVNLGTLDEDKRFVDIESSTTDFGAETNGNMEDESFAWTISIKAEQIRWKKTDKVYVCGGAAHRMIDAIRKHYPLAQVIDDPVTSNARAFYEIGRAVYGK